MRNHLIGLMLIVAVAPATPALACRDVIGRPPAPVATLSQQDATYFTDGAAAAIASVVDLDSEMGRFRIERPLRGAFDEDVTLPNEILVGCRSEALRVLPVGANPGDRVVVVRSARGDFSYSVILESERGQRLLSLFTRPDIAEQ